MSVDDGKRNDTGLLGVAEANKFSSITSFKILCSVQTTDTSIAIGKRVGEIESMGCCRNQQQSLTKLHRLKSIGFGKTLHETLDNYTRMRNFSILLRMFWDTCTLIHEIWAYSTVGLPSVNLRDSDAEYRKH